MTFEIGDSGDIRVVVRIQTNAYREAMEDGAYHQEIIEKNFD